jgi:hypothetical protein
MDLKYKKVMEENELSYSELPEDAQTGIDHINDVLKSFNMLERSGRKPTAKAMKKLAAMDKWVMYEIYDYLHDTDKNDDDIPFEADDVLEGDENINNEQKTDPVGLKIDEELALLYEQNITKIDADDLKTQAPTTYKTIWENYEDEVENGVETSHFSLIEQGNTKVFTLKKL